MSSEQKRTTKGHRAPPRKRIQGRAIPNASTRSLSVEYPLVLLKDQIAISPKEFKDIKKTIASIQGLIVKAGKKHGAQEGAWSNDSHSLAAQPYLHLSRGEYRSVNLLRLLSPYFTGFSLLEGRLAANDEFPSTIPPDFDARFAKMHEKPDAFFHRFQRLVRHLPPELVSRFPNRMGEVGYRFGEAIVNRDVVGYQERMNLLYESGILAYLQQRASRAPVSLLEIGSGYGALAFLLSKAVPQARYFLVDLPESLLFAMVYLKTTRPEIPQTLYASGGQKIAQVPGFYFVPSFMWDSLVRSGVAVDFGVNTLSFAEMPSAVVEDYAAGLKKILSPGGLVFDQNHGSLAKIRNGFSCKEIFAAHFAGRTLNSASWVTLDAVTLGEPSVWVEETRVLRGLRSARPYQGLKWLGVRFGHSIRKIASADFWFLKGFGFLRKTLVIVIGNRRYIRMVDWCYGQYAKKTPIGRLLGKLFP
jgi:hypothetical protein